MGVQLKEPLIKGVKYNIDLYTSNYDGSIDSEYKIVFSTSKSSNKPSGTTEIVNDKFYKARVSDGWQHRSIEYTPSRSNLKYLFIRTKLVNANMHMFLIDKISVKECGFENPCSRTNTKINPVTPGIISRNSYASISNIENVKTAKNMRIVTQWGTTVKTFNDITSINGLYPIKWDGRNNAGNIVSDAHYVWEYKLENDCYSYKGSFGISKTGAPAIINNYSTNDYANVSIPIECCEYEPIVYLLPGEYKGMFNVKAKKSIISNGGIFISPEAEKVVFSAGNSIELNGSFYVDNGVELEIKIEACD